MCDNCINGNGPHVSGMRTRREVLGHMAVAGTVVAGLSSPSLAAADQSSTAGVPTVGYAQLNEKAALQRHVFDRRALNADDVLIDVSFCGICHTDIHAINNDFGSTVWPLVPGHEIVGRVAAVGSAVTKYKVGDKAGVGCMVSSCGECEQCKAGFEQYCTKGSTGTYGLHRASGVNTLGGYSNKIVVREAFVIKIPNEMDLARTAPLLCAGITTFSPLEHWKIGEGDNVAVVGFGGLGHVAVKIAVARGANVTVMTTTASKKEDALAMGAKHVVVWPNADEFARLRSTFDNILTTIPYGFNPNPFLSLLKIDKSMVNVGLLSSYSDPVDNRLLTFGRKSLTSSLIGGIAETQQMVDFCASRGILADIEVIRPEQMNEAFSRVVNKDVRYRFVIDMSTMV